MAFVPAAAMADDFSGGSGDDVHDHPNTSDDTISGGGGEDLLDGSGGSDTVSGGADSDTVRGGDGGDTVYGESAGEPGQLVGSGDAQVLGSAGDDNVYGDGIAGANGSGGSTPDLVGGNDLQVEGDDGVDLIFGDGIVTNVAGEEGVLQGGNDTIWGDSPIASVLEGGDTIIGDGNVAGSLGALLLGGDDMIHGGGGGDFIIGDGTVDAFDDVLAQVIGGDDLIFGDAGNDTVYGDGGANGPHMNGSDIVNSVIGGDDTVHGGEGDDTIWGEGVNFAFVPTGGNDTLNGDAGNDTIYGQSGSDTIDGGDDNDLVAGEAVGHSESFVGEGDTVTGGAGDDLVFGDGTIFSGASEATLEGGADTVSGGTGHDDVFGDGTVMSDVLATLLGGVDILSGGDGDDTVSGDGTAVTGDGAATLNGGNDTLDGGLGADILIGDGTADVVGTGVATLFGGADTIHGGDGNDTIYGETAGNLASQTLVGGDDQLFGEAGDDVIDGQSGNDYLCGGSGSDVLTGGDGTDLACAVDDAVSVEIGKNGTLDVSLNDEKLSDETAEERAATHYSIVSLSPGMSAVIDEQTGVITIISANQDGQVQYQVLRDGNTFATLAMVFITVFDGPGPGTDPGTGPPPPRDDVIPVTPIITPVSPVEPVVDPIEDDVPAESDVADPLPGGFHPGAAGVSEPSTSKVVDGLVDPVAYGANRKSDSVSELLRGPLAPAVVVGVASTLMTTVAGGAGIASRSLASSRAGSSTMGPAGRARRSGRGGGGRSGSAKEAVGRETASPKRAMPRVGARELFTTIPHGIGPGDRSRTWRFPGWRPVDAASVVVPHQLAPHSPLMARLAVDGTEVRAMFGSLWALAPVAGIVVGVLAAMSVDGRAMPPPLWILLAGAILTTFDALAGAIASTIYIAAGVLSGAMTDQQSPDFVHSLLVYCGVGFLWTSIPLIGSAMRPFRRLGDGSARHAWDMVADLAIASLLCAWVTRGLIESMDSFAGVKTGLPVHASLVALVILACVGVRIIAENAAARLYPLRLQAVESSADFPEATVFAGLVGVAFRTALFSFIGYSFVGNCWQWWAGTVLYCAPQILTAVGTKFERVEWIQRLLPRGITALLLLLLIGAGVVVLVAAATTSDLETVRWVFMLLAVPPLVLTVLASFTTKQSGTTTWFQEFLGLGVVVATAWLAFNGWSS